MSRNRSYFGLITSMLMLAVAGCSEPRGVVSDQVTLNGQPLDKGVIVFNSLDAKSTASVSADIVNGHYSLETTAGMKQVQITAPIVTGTRPEYAGAGAPLVEITEERLPDKYHSASELTYAVMPGKNVDVNWPLQAEPLKR